MLWQLASTMGAFTQVLFQNQGEELLGCKGKSVDFCERNEEVTQQKSSQSFSHIQKLNQHVSFHLSSVSSELNRFSFIFIQIKKL